MMSMPAIVEGSLPRTEALIFIPALVARLDLVDGVSARDVHGEGLAGIYG